MRYAHFVHINGEIADADYEVVLGPFPRGLQLTYCWLRECENGDNVAVIREGDWYITDDDRPFSDVSFTETPPELVVMDSEYEATQVGAQLSKQDEILDPEPESLQDQFREHYPDGFGEPS